MARSPIFLAIILCNTLLCSNGSIAETIRITVQEGGNDSRNVLPGTSEFGPLQTIGRAIQLAIDLARRPNPPTLVRVEIGPGKYFVPRPIILDGSLLHVTALEIIGAGSERTIITGMEEIGKPAGSWQLPTDKSVEEEFVNTRRSFSAPPSPHKLLIWKDDEHVIPGRWPQKGWGYITKAERKADSWLITLEGADHLTPQLRGKRVRLHGFPGYDWAYEAVPATMVTHNQVEVPVSFLTYGAKPYHRVFIENVRTGSAQYLYFDTEKNVLAGNGQYSFARVSSFLEINNGSHISLRDVTVSGFSGMLFVCS